MSQVLGEYHATISAGTRAALEQGVQRWWTDRQRELEALRARPEGELTVTRNCCGTRSDFRRPLWLPKRCDSPERLELSWRAELRQETDCHVAFLTLVVSEREQRAEEQRVKVLSHRLPK